MRITSYAVLGAAALVACTPKTEEATPVTKPSAEAARYDEISRSDFNRTALELALPFFWRDDRDGDKALDAEELAILWGLSSEPKSTWMDAKGFTSAFRTAYERVRDQANKDWAAKDPAEQKRLALVKKDLEQGRPSLVENDFTSAAPAEREFLKHMLTAAEVIERLYAKQVGSFGMEQQIAQGDTLSRAHFYLNQGPWCSAPTTENEKECSSVPGQPKRISGLYPASAQTGDASFCDTLAKRKDAEELLTPFTVVTEDGKGGYKAVPYTEHFAADMQEVATALTAAAKAVEADASEKALHTYLTAAAKAFTDNNWFAADEAWAAMSADNSKWYLRVAPDETYFEPCSRKAGFHMTLARINPGSKDWQAKLTPRRADMEKAVAALAGPPYKAREVNFDLPDFIDIVLNAGDDRDARGATIGQSLPNWGPVANEGRGRTVAMTNLYTDADSKAAYRSQAESLLCAEAVASLTTESMPAVMTTVLHEATHNLGPAHEYKVKGKTDDAIFGGSIAAMLEELKAQTGALYYTDWLVEQGIIDRKLGDQAHLRDITWAFGHVSRGMYTADGKPKAYSQLAAIQLGALLAEGALTWKADATAANGTDKGCFAPDFTKMPAAVQKLAKDVFGIKGRGDKARAEALKKEHVDGEGQWKELRAVITERWQRQPQASFLYAIRMQ